MATPWKRETPAREAADSAGKRAHALVVDADPRERRALVRLLADDGLAVASAATAADAIAALEDRLPDLVVLDLDLAPPGAADVCERIRATAGASDTPIVARSAGPADAAIARAFEMGANDFASKSEPPAVLLARARLLLRARAQLVALRATEARLREAQQLAQLASWRYDLATRALTGGAELWRVLGTARGVLPRMPHADREQLAERMRECLRGGRAAGGELRATGDAGAERVLRYRMRLALSAEGEPLALEGVVQDVSAWRRSEQRAEFLAEHDAVTGLRNRAGLLAELARLAADPGARARSHGVIAIGVDGVARVAESLGRDAADELLREAARRLADAADGALLAHTSESQFVQIVPGARDSEALIARAERALAALDAPIRLETHELSVPAAAGAALFPRDGADAASVLRSAERALAQARAGGARVQAHSAATSAEALRRFTLASRLRAAIAKGELVLHYQPKVALSSGDITGFEALVRWREPELGMLPPSEFIPLAEESGLVGELGDWVLREACRQIVAWRAAGLGDVPVAVNVSAQQLRREGTAARVAQILREAGVRPALLGIEVTESVLLDDAERAIRELRALRELGVELALDDFGTGFSSLSYLRRLPVQIVKIDREFVAEISSREDAAALTASIVSMAKALWLRVVAEGVEKEAERDLVAVWGCEEAQGFLFSPPVGADEAARLWRARGVGSRAEPAAG
jgi:diguanylate cyclase (GGDEF)-like protein